MQWYVKTECGDVRGPMSQEDAEHERDRLDDAMMFNERIFSPQFVCTEEVEELLGDLRAMRSGETPMVAGGLICKRAIDTITLLSREKVVRGTINGGVLELDEVSDGVDVDIRDYDTEGVDSSALIEDESGTHFQAG